MSYLTACSLTVTGKGPHHPDSRSVFEFAKSSISMNQILDYERLTEWNELMLKYEESNFLAGSQPDLGVGGIRPSIGYNR